MSDNKEQEEGEILISEKEFWDVIEFARAMSGGIYGNTYLTPDIINARMRDINLNPSAATETTLATAMLDPKGNEKNLQEFSQNFELTSMVYKRLLSYLSNMLAFDLTYTSNAKPEDYNTLKHKKDLRAIETFLEKFNYKRELRIAVREMLRNDAYFACFVDTGSGYVLQELPPEYCKITGRWDGGFLFSFNMYWFLLPGVDINMYPDFFKKKYKEIWGNPNTKNTYKPSGLVEDRGSSSWVYWQDVPPSIGVCFKLTPELATRLPYFTPLFNDLVLQGLMRTLQKNMNMAAASKIIMGEVPMLNKETKATVKDSMAVSPELLGKFMALIKSAMSEAIKVASAPLQEIEGISFDTDNEMYSSFLRTALASSGINTNLIFSDNIKPNAIETQLSLNVDEQMMTGLYEQFNDFINYFANKHTTTYKFEIQFEGTQFFVDREARMSVAMDLFDKGIILPQKIAAAMGMRPSQLRKHMEESKAMGFMDLLTPPALEQQKIMADVSTEDAKELADQGASNAQELAKTNAKLAPKPVTGSKSTATKSTATKSTSTSSGERGRPKKKLSELGESGMETRGNASNVGRGGKTR